jgi:uncharacterized membrane protein YgcG
MLTDGDQWMLRALQAVMPDTRRLACIWHLYKNVWTHCRGLYGEGKKAQWARFIRLWWRLAQETDATARDTWDADWAELTAAVTADVADSPARAAALTWLAELAARREAWAARWTWQYFTSGCDATQRTEAVNNAVKGYLSASMLLTNLVAKIDDYNRDVDRRADTRGFNLARRAALSPPSPLLDSIRRIATPYAFDIVRAQHADVLAYKSVKVDERDGVAIYSVQRVSNGSGGRGQGSHGGGGGDAGGGGVGDGVAGGGAADGAGAGGAGAEGEAAAAAAAAADVKNASTMLPPAPLLPAPPAPAPLAALKL